MASASSRSTPQTSGGSSILRRQAASPHISSATAWMTGCTVSTSVPHATSTSSSARAHCCDMLPTRAMVPFGMCHTVPCTSRIRVVRNVMASTVPVAGPASMMSPTPNWSSTSMKMPARKSFTRLWAPKPMATPAMPAPAMSGPRFTPSSPRMMVTAIVQMTALAMPRNTVPSVRARAAERSESEPLSSTAAGARRRRLRSRSCDSGAAILLVSRRIARRTSRLATNAASSTSRMWAGVASSLSAASAHPVLSVHSSTRRQT